MKVTFKTEDTCIPEQGGLTDHGLFKKNLNNKVKRTKKKYDLYIPKFNNMTSKVKKTKWK